MDESVYQGTCLCEGVKFTVQGKPENIFACYCTDCQKNAGGPLQMVELPNAFTYSRIDNSIVSEIP
jgi:hypothetical protein